MFDSTLEVEHRAQAKGRVSYSVMISWYICMHCHGEGVHPKQIRSWLMYGSLPWFSVQSLLGFVQKLEQSGFICLLNYGTFHVIGDLLFVGTIIY